MRCLRLPTAPGPRGHEVMASVLRGRTREPLRYYRTLIERFGNVVFMRVGTKTFCLLNDAHHIEHVLKDNQRNYTKGPGYDRIRPFLGDGLLTSEGEAWRRQRKLVQPSFHYDAVARFAETVTRLGSSMVDGWGAAADAGRSLDIAAEMAQLTLAVVGQTLLGSDPSGRAAEVRAAVAEIQRTADEQGQSWLRVLDVLLPIRRHVSSTVARHLPTESNRRFRAAVQTLDEIVYRLIAERQRSGGAAKDLLDLLMQARDDESVQGMSDAQLRDEVMTMLLAGYETTAAALTWAFHVLDCHQDVESRLRDELGEVLAGRPPAFADLGRLPYLDRVLGEVLRLYPPVWRLSRHALGDDAVGGYAIPAGCVMLLSPWLTHRNPAYWPDPERFDPDRFQPAASSGRPRFAYIPFGGGPRICIGNSFALMEARLILALVLQRYRLRPVAGHSVEIEPRITMRPRGGLPMRLEPAAR
ncbi:MAG: cytochrome P450 [Candidatus Rokuibacteriota bacterium]